MLNRVSWRVQSTVLSGGQITQALGTDPTSCRGKGRLVSSRRPGGPVHGHTTRVRREASQDIDWRLLDSPVLRNVDQVRALDPAARVDLVCMACGAETGSMVQIEASVLAALGNAGCGILLDIYDSDDED